ncbi:Kinase suppressor of Ras 1 [Pseudolycoriella hygida]|uniref:Kinase suppressor of Ras 1 n=1 Tax=Pseudolycoriella hygida TaxID=35572 RepID=A0A9Q0MP61_9DIPT|nr:Kinase suppressor of Ras 1 [Pseudolycoriella hygida]
MADNSEKENETNIRRGLDVIQSMIDLSADRLEGLRTQCATSAELTQQEIRLLEAKLVKMFSELLITKSKLPERLPRGLPATGTDLKQWLRVVGLSSESLNVVTQRVSTLEVLLDKNDTELCSLLNNNANVREEEIRRLVRAMLNLKRCRESINLGEKEPADLYWDSWDRHHHVRSGASPRPNRPVGRNKGSHYTYPTKQEVQSPPPEIFLPEQNTKLSKISPEHTSSTPSPSPPLSPLINNNKQKPVKGFPTTPPPYKKHQTYLGQPQSNLPTAGTYRFDNSINIPVPRSPIMGHMIAHRFAKKFKMGTCDLCHKQVIYGLRCKDCKYLCHKDCENRVPPSCCLPQELIDEFIKTLPSDIFISGNNSPTIFRSKCYDRQANVSSPTSSCNSSTPSSPAPGSMNIHVPHTPATNKQTQFDFPDSATSSSSASTVIYVQEVDTPQKDDCIQKPVSPRPVQTATDVLSEKTTSQTSTNSASTSSDRTYLRVDSFEDSEERDDDDNTWQEQWNQQNSVSLKEWDIPFDDLEIMEKIGDGRFGTVHRAQWHGAVAVKLLKENYLDNEAFKLEVATFKKTRHENVVLFMGACIKPQAIVTSLCKGNTLYTHIHQRRDKFNLNKTTMVAQQISQGMGYLHARDIVHKDLKTKNIFLENGKVVITDFGLFSATKLQYDKNYGLEIPSGWLCYLAPELIQVLQPCRPAKDNMPFSKASDIYAFGTVWYELLCGEFPFKSQASEAVIFQVGRGMKQTLANLQASRDVKDILMTCWAYEPGNRPDFAKLLTLLERLPKKRLARSPSHPVQLSRSAESVF